MGYTRDKDMATRGVGAIAARDKAHPRATMQRKAARARATALRDRALSHLTYGARGGLALGAISKANVGILTSVMSPTIKTGGVIEGGPSATPSFPPLYVPPPLVGPTVKNRFQSLAARAPADAFQKLAAPLYTSPLDPVSVAVLPPAPSGSSSTSSGGATVGGKNTKVGVITGGGGGGGGGGAGISISQPALPDFGPDETLPDPGAGTPAKAGVSTKTLAIAGALGIGAWLLLRKKRQS